MSDLINLPPVPDEHFDRNFVICPYCGGKREATTDDDEMGDCDEECEDCGRTFRLIVIYDVTYHTRAKEKSP